MNGNRPSCVLMAHISTLTTPRSPVLWVVHIRISDDFREAPSRYDMSEKHAHGLIMPTSLDQSCRGERLYLETFCFRGNYRAEQA
jgi:hypothetical protein